MTVISPIEGTPAWRAGIQGGDRIIKIDGASTEGLSLDDAMKRMRGEKGTSVVLTMYREGREKPIDFTIVRDIITIKSVPYAGVLSNGVGYIRLSNFSERSREEIDAALAKVEKENPKGLILDLRYNPGGLLSQAVEVSEEFAPRGKKIVYTRGRDPSQNKDFFSSSDQPHSRYPLVVLVNQYTASASEIVSGAVQDLDLGLVAGQTTFGKGLVQTVIPLTRSVKGPKLKLTTAKYYTPSGRCIQKDEQLKDGALASEDEEEDETPVLPDAMKANKPKPVFHTEMGRTVYGGGGITPDVTAGDTTPVPTELALQNALGKKIPQFRDAITDYAMSLKGANTVTSTDFAVTDAMREGVWQGMRQRGIEIDRAIYDGAAPLVSRLISYDVARYVFGRPAEQRRIVQDDPMVQRAVELTRGVKTQKDLLARVSENQGRRGE